MSIKREKIVAAAQKYIQKGSFKRAIREYQKIVKAHPDDVRTLQKVGDLQARDGQTDAAVETYNEVADHYVAQGFFLKAVAVYKQLLRIAPEKLEARLRLADLYVQLSLIRDALANYQQVADRYLEMGWIDAYLGTLERVTEVDPENASSRILFAEQLAKYEHPDIAADQFLVAIRLLRQAGRIEECCKVGERYVHLRPDDVEQVYVLAETYLSQGRAKRALMRVQSVFRERPNDPKALDLLVRSLDGLGERSRAVSVLEELASTFEEEGAGEARDAALRQLLKLEPNHAFAREVLGVAEAAPLPEAAQPGVILDAAPEGAAAVPAAAASAAPADPAAVEKLLGETDVYLKYNLYDKALEHLQQVFALDPVNLGGLERRKAVQLATGDVEGAVRTLIGMARLAAESDPVQGRAYLHQALAVQPDDANVLAVLAELDGGPPAPEVQAATPSAAAAPSAAPAPPVSGEAYRELDALFSQFEHVDSAVGHKALDEDAEFISELTTEESEAPSDDAVVSLDNLDILPAQLDEALEAVDALISAGDADGAQQALFALLGEWPGHDEIILDRMNALSSGAAEAPQHSGLAVHDTVEVAPLDESALDAARRAVEEPSDDDDLFLPEEPHVTGKFAGLADEDDDDVLSVPDVELPADGVERIGEGRVTGELEIAAAGALIANVLDGAAEAYTSSEHAVVTADADDPYDATEEIEIIVDGFDDDDGADFEDVEMDALSAVDLAPAGRPSPLLQLPFGPSERVLSQAGEGALAAAIRERRGGGGMSAMPTLQEETLGDHPRAASYELALANMELGLYVDAVGALERLLGDTGLSGADRLLVRYHIGVAYEALNQPVAAASHLREVAASDPVHFPDARARVRRLESGGSVA